MSKKIINKLNIGIIILSLLFFLIGFLINMEKDPIYNKLTSEEMLWVIICFASGMFFLICSVLIFLIPIFRNKHKNKQDYK